MNVQSDGHGAMMRAAKMEEGDVYLDGNGSFGSKQVDELKRQAKLLAQDLKIDDAAKVDGFVEKGVTLWTTYIENATSDLMHEYDPSYQATYLSPLILKGTTPFERGWRVQNWLMHCSHLTTKEDKEALMAAIC